MTREEGDSIGFRQLVGTSFRRRGTGAECRRRWPWGREGAWLPATPPNQRHRQPPQPRHRCPPPSHGCFRIGVPAHPPQTRSHRELKAARRLRQDAWGPECLLTPGVWTPGRGKVHFCCFKPPALAYGPRTLIRGHSPDSSLRSRGWGGELRGVPGVLPSSTEPCGRARQFWNIPEGCDLSSLVKYSSSIRTGLEPRSQAAGRAVASPSRGRPARPLLCPRTTRKSRDGFRVHGGQTPRSGLQPSCF